MAMGAATIQQMADRVAALLDEKLDVRGRTLGDRLRRGAGKLPRAVRAEARFLCAPKRVFWKRRRRRHSTPS